MILYCLAINLPGWAKSIILSYWTYIAIAAVFGAILLVVLGMLLKSLFSNKSLRRPRPGRKKGDVSVVLSPQQIPTEELTSLILALRQSPRTVLFGAAGLHCMPVTIPIRLAVRLAATGKKCLLIDLDTRRDAMARVFRIPVKNPPSFEPVPTSADNIRLIAAHVFGGSKTMNIQPIVRAAKKKYDVILISAPYLDGHPDRRLIAAAAAYAVLFVQIPAQMERLETLCKSAGCKIIARYRTETPPDAQPEPPSQ